MTATDEQHGQLDTGYPHTLRPELHKALMARGIDYWVAQGLTFWNRDDGCECLAFGYVANGVPKLAIKVVGFTDPEQAVEATLGQGGMEWHGDVLVLTLPRDPSSIHVHRADGQPRKVYPSEATLGRGTCRIEERHGDWYCTGCGEMVGASDPTDELHIDGNAIRLWGYCPRCGREVVE